ncbi:MAG: hypothetical protein SVU32_07685 [Candidatus Nanohaloarchaea archaeon]|nr:hypothetical protein [Candidatus Nanohaloarchaea archaeon]
MKSDTLPEDVEDHSYIVDRFMVRRNNRHVVLFTTADDPGLEVVTTQLRQNSRMEQQLNRWSYFKQTDPNTVLDTIIEDWDRGGEPPIKVEDISATELVNAWYYAENQTIMPISVLRRQDAFRPEEAWGVQQARKLLLTALDKLSEETAARSVPMKLSNDDQICPHCIKRCDAYDVGHTRQGRYRMCRSCGSIFRIFRPRPVSITLAGDNETSVRELRRLWRQGYSQPQYGNKMSHNR